MTMKAASKEEETKKMMHIKGTNKKYIKTVCCTSLFILSSLGGMSAFAQNIGFAQCNEDYVNVRAEASGESEVIGKLYQNGRVDILETSTDGNWYHIRSGNVEGYVSADFIVTGDQAEDVAATAGYTTAEVGAEVLNVHASTDVDSEIVGSVYENREYEVVEDQGDWVKVVTGDGTYGWVSTDYVYVSTEYGTAETLEEEQARLDEAWIAYLAEQEQSDYGYDASDAWAQAEEAQSVADIAAENANAAQQQADEAYQAYVDAQTVADESVGTTQETDAQSQAQDAYAAYEQAQSDADAAASTYYDAQATADTATADAYASAQETVDTTGTDTTSEVSDSSGSSTGAAIANYACQFVGNPYVYGGSSLTDGADCSGFVMSVFANFGISLPHEAAAQSGYGTAVDASSLQPGDLVFYGSGGISHVAIYIGNGAIVHAANSASGICYGNVNYNTPVAYRRLV